MLALIVLAPAAGGVPWWLERQEQMAYGAIPPPAPLVDGDTAELAGSTWEFRGTVVGETGGEEKPEGLELVDAIFLVTPEDDVAGVRLRSSCSFRAVDSQGRAWEQTSSFGLRELPEEVGDTSWGCTDPEGETIAPGEEQALVASFLVPEDAVASLRFEVEVATHDPDIDYEEDVDLEDIDWDALFEHDPDYEENPPRPAAISFQEDPGET